MSSDNEGIGRLSLNLTEENLKFCVPGKPELFTTISIEKGVYDPPQVIHPGFVGQRIDGSISWPKERVTEARKARRMESYLAFSDFSDIDELHNAPLNKLLEDIFNKTKNYWEPKLCQECALRMLNSITSGDVDLPPNFKAAWVYKINHSWLEIWIDEVTEPIIFDPTGLDIRAWSSSANMYAPYFGLRSKAPRHLEHEYNYSKHIQRIFSNKPDVAIRRYTDWKTDEVTVTEIPRSKSDARLWDDKINGISIVDTSKHWMNNLHDQEEL